MKTLQLIVSILITSIAIPVHAQSAKVDTNVLVGEWKLDMTPENTTDANFAKMVIKKVENNEIEGYFYRDGVSIRNGKINTQLGIIYGALVSGDNSGEYNTAFYYKDGKLHGSTHSLERDFLAVWIATKETN